MLLEKIDYDKIPELAKKMKSCFAYNININKNAYLNWRVSKGEDVGIQFWCLAEGYFESAISLIDICLKDNLDKKADIYIFPILFNIVQGTELSLKAIIDYLYIILKEQHKLMGGHNIKQLSQEAMSRFIEFKQQDGSKEIEECITALQLAQKFIENIYDKTDDMAFARYPIDSKKQEMFYTATHENVVVDLEILREQSAYVFSMLDFIIDTILRYMEYLSYS